MRKCKKCGGSWMREFAVGCNHVEACVIDTRRVTYKREMIFEAAVRGTEIRATHPLEPEAVRLVEEKWRRAEERSTWMTPLIEAVFNADEDRKINELIEHKSVYGTLIQAKVAKARIGRGPESLQALLDSTVVPDDPMSVSGERVAQEGRRREVMAMTPQRRKQLARNAGLEGHFLDDYIIEFLCLVPREPDSVMGWHAFGLEDMAGEAWLRRAAWNAGFNYAFETPLIETARVLMCLTNKRYLFDTFRMTGMKTTAYLLIAGTGLTREELENNEILPVPFDINGWDAWAAGPHVALRKRAWARAKHLGLISPEHATSWGTAQWLAAHPYPGPRPGHPFYPERASHARAAVDELAMREELAKRVRT